MNDVEFEFKKPNKAGFNARGIQVKMDSLDKFCIALIIFSLFAFTVFIGLKTLDLSEQVKVLKADVYRLKHPVIEWVD